MSSWTRKAASLLPVVFLSLLLGACVTINIYFPAAAAEKAADRIIDEVWQLRQSAPATPPATPVGKEPQS